MPRQILVLQLVDRYRPGQLIDIRKEISAELALLKSEIDFTQINYINLDDYNNLRTDISQFLKLVDMMARCGAIYFGKGFGEHPIYGIMHDLACFYNIEHIYYEEKGHIKDNGSDNDDKDIENIDIT